MKQKNLSSPENYSLLKEQIKNLLTLGREEAIRSVNSILVQTYWNIGKYIVEFEQKGKGKADYGSELLIRLAKDLTIEYGKGFSRSNLFQIRKFYLTFPKIQTLSGQLSWSHYVEILKAEDPFVSKYQLYLPEKERLVSELNRLLKENKE